MELTACSECSKEISDQAVACPNCGAPREKKSTGGPGFMGWSVILLIALAIIGKVVEQNGGSHSTAVTSAPSVPQDNSPAMQAKRLDILEGLQQQEIFGETTASSPGFIHLVVRPRFYMLAHKDKLSFVSVACAYHFDGRTASDTVILKDSRTNKTVGMFSTQYGLRLD